MNAPLFLSPPRVLEPGLNALPANTERYLVRAGGSVALLLAPGDEIELISPEGLQPGEITVFDANGNSDPALIGARSTGKAEALKTILDGGGGSADSLRNALALRNLDISKAHSTTIFGNHSPAGDSVSLGARENLTCLVAAPATDMRIRVASISSSSVVPSVPTLPKLSVAVTVTS